MAREVSCSPAREKKSPILSLAEAEREWPEAVACMDWALDHLVHGDDFLLKRTKNRRLQASCRGTGPRYERIVDETILRIERQEGYRSKLCVACDGAGFQHCQVALHSPHCSRASMLRNPERMTATWHPEAGVWRRETLAAVTMCRAGSWARDTTDVDVRLVRLDEEARVSTLRVSPSAAELREAMHLRALSKEALHL